MIDVQLIAARSLVEQRFEYREWVLKLPFISIPAEYKIKFIPPFSGAVARFWITTEELEKKDKYVSAYFDAYGELGYMNEPYWEIYLCGQDHTNEDDYVDIERFLLGEEDKMIEKAIEWLKMEEG